MYNINNFYLSEKGNDRIRTHRSRLHWICSPRLWPLYYAICCSVDVISRSYRQPETVTINICICICSIRRCRQYLWHYRDGYMDVRSVQLLQVVGLDQSFEGFNWRSVDGGLVQVIPVSYGTDKEWMPKLFRLASADVKCFWVVPNVVPDGTGGVEIARCSRLY